MLYVYTYTATALKNNILTQSYSIYKRRFSDQGASTFSKRRHNNKGAIDSIDSIDDRRISIEPVYIFVICDLAVRVSHPLLVIIFYSCKKIITL